MKAMIELRKMDDDINEAITSKRKTEWSDEELARIEEKRKLLDKIVAEGKGEYNEERFGAIEYGYSNQGNTPS